MTSFNGEGIAYDAIGNPLSYEGNTLTWTMGRQLATYGANTYTYNEDGIRTSKTVNGVTTKFYLNGTDIIEQTDGTNTLHFFYDSTGEIIGFKHSGNNYFYIKNSMDDIVAIADSTGTVVTEYTYSPWGEILSVTGSNVNLGNLNPFRYRSYYYDSDIEMYYLQSRYYNPEIYRFINSDDVNYIGVTESEISYNPFSYCENNAVNDSDPTGTVAITIVLKTALGALMGAAGYLIEWFVEKYILKSNPSFKISKMLVSIVLGTIDGWLSTKKIKNIVSFVIAFVSNIITTISDEYSIFEVFIISLVVSLVSTLISNKITKGNVSFKKISKYDKQVSSAWKKSIKKNNFKIIRSMLHKYFIRMQNTFKKYITSSILSTMFGTSYNLLHKKIRRATA